MNENNKCYSYEHKHAYLQNSIHHLQHKGKDRSQRLVTDNHLLRVEHTLESPFHPTLIHWNPNRS